MEQMTITAKVQIAATDADKVLLDETMSVYRDACNYVSDYVFQTHDLKQFSLNKVLYSTLREKFGLKSQMAQSVLKTVIARYRTIPFTPRFENVASYRSSFVFSTTVIRSITV